MRTRRFSLYGLAIVMAALAAVGMFSTPGTVRAPGARIDALLHPCDADGVDGTVECGDMRVPVDHAARGGHVIDISVLVVRARVPTGAEPIFFFTGGPGSAASQSAGWLARDFDAARDGRDLVFIDQRGTGRSHPLQCARPPGVVRRLAPMFDESETRACFAKLSPGPDLAKFTTSDAARDVELIRKALGYRAVNVHGSSYGTRAAWLYAAMFPASVRSMILHGPAPPGFRMPLPFSRGLDVALEGVLVDCASDEDCARRYPNLRRDLERTFDGVKAAPAAVAVDDGVVGDVAAPLTPGEVAEGLRYLLYTTPGARRIPALLTQAAAGDYTPLARAAVEQRRTVETLHRGMYLSVTCAEDIPFILDADIQSDAIGTRLGDYRVRQQQRACKEWTRGAELPKVFFEPLGVPTLVLAGEYDPATPLDGAKRGMSLLPHGKLVVIPHGAHSFFGLGIDGCLADTMNAFIARGSVEGLDVSCVASAKRPPPH